MVNVYVSTVINASADTVWSRIRDFNAMPQWHPGIADSRIENDQAADRVGCIRHFHTRDGGMMTNYISTLQLTPVTDGNRCFAEWSAEFECAPGREAELTQHIGQGVFQAGFDALKRAYA